MFTQLNLARLCLTIVLATLAVALAGAQAARAISAPVLIDAVTVENGVAIDHRVRRRRASSRSTAS